MAAYLQRVKEQAATLGLPLTVPHCIPSTRLAHEATEFAREHGRQNAFRRAVFHRFYGPGENIGAIQVLQQAVRDAGLDPEALHETLRSQRYRPRVEALLQQAADEEVETSQIVAFSGAAQGGHHVNAQENAHGLDAGPADAGCAHAAPV